MIGGWTPKAYMGAIKRIPVFDIGTPIMSLRSLLGPSYNARNTRPRYPHIPPHVSLLQPHMFPRRPTPKFLSCRPPTILFKTSAAAEEQQQGDLHATQGGL